MLHPHTELRPVSSEIGLGVFATRFIARGTLVRVHDQWDVCCAPEKFQKLDPLQRDTLERFARITRGGEYRMSWDIARFMNHSCEPNAGLSGQVVLVAMRDIRDGEEILYDYAMSDGS